MSPWGDLVKPSRTARKKAKAVARRDRGAKERSGKATARKRDHYRCRFPLCGCKALGLKLQTQPEVSHDQHKGMGGNPAGDRSTPELLITFCHHRHQDGVFSRHKGTLRTRYLTDLKNNGPVAFDLDAAKLRDMHLAYPMSLDIDGWVEVAYERGVQQLAALVEWQEAILHTLAEMNV